MRKLAGILVAIATLVAGAAVAEARGKLGVGLRATSQTVAPEGNEENHLELGGGGLHVRYRFTRLLGIELTAEHLKAEKGGGDFVRESSPVTLAATIHFGGLLWDWYGIVGVGATESEVTFRRGDAMATETFVESHVHLGIGLERTFGPLAIGAELRAIGLSRNPEEGDAPKYGDLDGPVAKESQGAQFNLALTYYF
jgi:hypothetical protein